MAISASLLPPAVNCGLLWSVSLVEFISNTQNSTTFIGFAQPTAGNLSETVGGYKPRYSEDLPLESFLLGLVSLTLTLINILCIIITGVLILRLKEVTSTKVPQKFQDFWSTDVKAHRDYYKAYKKEEGAERKPISTLKFEDLPTCEDDQGEFYLNREINIILLYGGVGLGPFKQVVGGCHRCEMV